MHGRQRLHLLSMPESHFETDPLVQEQLAVLLAESESEDQANTEIMEKFPILKTFKSLILTLFSKDSRSLVAASSH